MAQTKEEKAASWKKWYEANKEKRAQYNRDYAKRYRADNSTILKEKDKNRDNKEERNLKRLQHYHATKDTEASKERRRKYYRDNSDIIKGRVRAWEEDNRVYVKDRRAKHYLANKSRLAAEQKIRSAKRINSLVDGYVIERLKADGFEKEYIKSNQILIETKRIILKTKRL